jgi:hypothetical protein
LQEYDPEKYAHAGSIVATLKNREADAWALVTGGTLTSTVVYDDDRIHTVAPRVQYLIEEADDVARSLHKQIERWQIRGRLYQQFMAEHPHPSADEMQDELFEIETYVAYHQGYQAPELEPELTDNPLANISEMMTYFE